MTKIFLVRHAQSKSNIDPRALHITTNMGIPLSPLGMQQALEVGKFIADSLPVAEDVKVWNSPYTRTRQTAIAIKEAIKIIREDKRALTATENQHVEEEESIYLAERQFGLVDNVENYREHFKFEAEHYNMHKEQNHDFFARPPLGESPFDMCMRLDFFIRTILAQDKAKTHVIVSHGAAIRGFILMAQKQPFETYTSQNPANASVRLIDNGEYVGEVFCPSEKTY